MTKEFIYNFIRQHPLAVISTTGAENKPQAALVGIAVTAGLEIIFDTVNSSRKYHNLVTNPHIALVIGWDDEITIQYEGIAQELTTASAQEYKEIYYLTYPDGRERTLTWPGLVHFKITPVWIRYSNFKDPNIIEEMNF